MRTLAAALALVLTPLAAQTPALGEGWSRVGERPTQLQWRGPADADRMIVTLYPPAPAELPPRPWLAARIEAMEAAQSVRYEHCSAAEDSAVNAAVQFCELPTLDGGRLTAGFVAAANETGATALVVILAARNEITRRRMLGDLRALVGRALAEPGPSAAPQ